MRDHLEAIRAAGAELVVVGSGNTRFAAAFKAEREIDFPLLADPELTAYAAAGLKRGVLATFSLRSLGSAARAFKQGERQGSVQGDPWQQGGVFVILPGGALAFAQVSQRTGDHADPEAVLDALRAPA